MLRNVWNALFPHDITEAPSGGCILIFCLSKNILKFKEFISVISTKKLQSTFFSGHPGTWSICWQLCSVGLHICSILWFRIGSISWKSESSKTSALWFNLAVGKCEILLSTHVYYIECKYCCFPVEGIEIYVFQVLFMESRVVWAFLQKTHTYVGAQHHWSPHKLTVVNCFMICMGLCLSTKTIIRCWRLNNFLNELLGFEYSVNPNTFSLSCLCTLSHLKLTPQKGVVSPRNRTWDA